MGYVIAIHHIDAAAVGSQIILSVVRCLHGKKCLHVETLVLIHHFFDHAIPYDSKTAVGSRKHRTVRCHNGSTGLIVRKSVFLSIIFYVTVLCIADKPQIICVCGQPEIPVIIFDYASDPGIPQIICQPVLYLPFV